MQPIEIAPLQARAQRPAELAALYIFAHLQARDPRLWRGSRHAGTPRLSRQQAGGLSPLELLHTFQLKGVGRDSQQGLIGWLEGRYPLIARTDIPSPREMLDAQTRGRRFVSLLLQPEEQFRPYGRHAGALEFLLHDLEHAHKFFGDSQSTCGQIRFFRLLATSVEELFTWGDEKFAHDLEYLMADMNSHPIHLMKYFKAIVLSLSQRRPFAYEDRCDRVFAAWGLPETIRQAARHLNNPGHESADDHNRLTQWFFDFNPIS